ncbi:DNA-processing protein DprA [Actinoplanes couchii]|uniref:Smf/DprA SLOG domain-containing protein n=1 Tax=Actinoplanes couchii TaxID=403638 RepID=A0ABQ3XSS9_9ACTN|nr:DNA-processing protein DprA [Actinoplanes couchii]MDR6324034.1 DNA processing protein [Actinoplanes couchii]GID61561.1 hypothetical protein Aco03nite_099650 [Actinoplanes couchii]
MNKSPATPYRGRLAIADSDDRLALAGLTALTAYGNPTVRTLVRQHGAVDTYRRLTADEQAHVPGRVDRVRHALSALHRGLQRLVIPGDPDWPANLDAVPPTGFRQPPLALWVHGTAPLATALQRSVAVVGSKAATSYGNHVATEIASGCTAGGWTVVASGGFGCDAAAHRAALAQDAVTVAVLGGGLDRPHPAGHNALFDRITEKGVLVSPYPPDTHPTRARHIARMALIGLLTSGSVLVEAAQDSNALVTLKTSAGLGRPVMAVPGPVTSALSSGPHQLLRRPLYRLVTSAADVLAHLTKPL